MRRETLVGMAMAATFVGACTTTTMPAGSEASGGMGPGYGAFVDAVPPAGDVEAADAAETLDLAELDVTGGADSGPWVVPDGSDPGDGDGAVDVTWDATQPDDVGAPLEDIGPPPADVGEDAASAELPAEPLPLGFWCGPPEGFTAVERFQEIAAAGFTFVMPPCSGPITPELNHQILDGALAAGLGVYVADGRMPLAVSGVPDADARLDAIVADYASHPALAGYFVADEPSAAAFAGLGEVFAGLRARDPSHPAYCDVLPTYASAAQLGTKDYPSYLDGWLTAAEPAVLSYDHYHFLLTGDRPGFFDNLVAARAAGLAQDVPFWQIVLAIPHLVYRPLTEAEKRWEVMQTLAYGGKGAMYFTYWTPPIDGWGSGLISVDGAQTTQYGEVQGINADAAAIGRLLVPATSVAVFQGGRLDPGGLPRRPGDVALVSGDTLTTVGIFESAGESLVLVANRDYEQPASVPVVLAASDPPRALEPASGEWVVLPTVATADGFTRVDLEIGAGDATLLRTGAPQVGPPGAEAMVGTVRADAGAMFSVDSVHGLTVLGPGGWSTCFPGTTLVGVDFQSNGFWLCAREDLADRAFTVGNVVGDTGYLFRVQGGEITDLGLAGWGTCPTGSLAGTFLDSNGFWLCIDPG